MAFSALGIDRAIAITILNRGWGLVAGPATLLLVAIYLSPVEQGFYYAFTSVLGLQVFFELGLGFVIMQTVSHEMANLRTNGADLVGDAASRARLGRLLSDVLLWYAVIAVAFTLLVGAGGAWFLGRAPQHDDVAWRHAWILVVPVFGLSIVVNAGFSFLEGMGFVADVALVRLAQAVIGMAGLAALLASGGKLLSLLALHGANLAIGGGWLLWRHGAMLWRLRGVRAPRGAIDWAREIWPFQWRIAASWAAGYFGTQAITLLLFERLGPVDAGRFGLTLSALGAVSGAATAWITTKAPRFGALAASRRHAELDALYRGAFRMAMAVASLGALLFCAAVAALHVGDLALSRRFVPVLALVAMSVATVVSVKVSAEASYLRAFRREPYLRLSVVTGIAQVAVAAVLSTHGQVTWVALGYAAVTVAIGAGWAHGMFVRLRGEYGAH